MLAPSDNPRSPENIARIRVWKAQGESDKEIGARLGIAGRQVRSIRDYFNIPGLLAPSDPARAWSDEKTAQASQLWADGLSARDIGARFGVTRNAILGLAMRRRELFPSRKTKSGHKRKRDGTDGALATRIYARRERREPSRNRIMAMLSHLRGQEVTDIPAETSVFACTLMELKPMSCRWPVGNPADEDFRFCGATKLRGVAYCAAHALRAYRWDKR